MAFTDEQNRLICRNLIRRSSVLRRYRWDAKDHCGATGKCCRNLQRFVLQVFDSRNSCFSLCWRIFIPSALRRRRTPCRRMRLCFLLTAQLRRILAACRWLSEAKAFVFIENDAGFSCTDCRRRSKRLTTTMTRRTSAHCWKRAVCSQGRHGAGGCHGTRLILTVSHQGQIGRVYPQVLETLVRGACRSYLHKRKGCSDAAFQKEYELACSNPIF